MAGWRELVALVCVGGIASGSIAAPPAGSECSPPISCGHAHPGTPAANAELASSFNSSAVESIREGDLETALAKLSQAIDLDPNLEVAHINRGLIHQRKGSYDLAIADFNRVLALPGSITFTPLRRAGALEHLAETHLLKLEFELALQHLSKALTFSPGSYRGYASRSLALLALGRNAQAIEDANRATWIKPESTYVRAVRQHVAAGGAIDWATIAPLISVTYTDGLHPFEPRRMMGIPVIRMTEYFSDTVHKLQTLNAYRHECVADNWYSLRVTVFERRLSLAVELFQESGNISLVDDADQLSLTPKPANCPFLFSIARKAPEVAHLAQAGDHWLTRSGAEVSNLGSKVGHQLSEACQDMQVIVRSYSGVIDHRTTMSSTGLAVHEVPPTLPGEKIRLPIGGTSCGLVASVFTSPE